MVKPAKRPKGLLCPNCAVPMWVRRTIPLTNGSVRRVRRCKKCGHRESTTERSARTA
jgi:transcriptional regulator NrdR family protein